MTIKIACPIWGSSYEATANSVWITSSIGGEPPSDIVEGLVHSERAGGAFRMSEEAHMALNASHLTDQEKAWLTTILIDQRLHGNDQPSLIREDVFSVLKSSTDRNLPLQKRAERLLRYLVLKTGRPGNYVGISQGSYEAFAWSESINLNEIKYLLDYLKKEELLTFARAPSEFQITVTVDGHAKIESPSTQSNSTQSFVAMWIDDEMEEAYNLGIKPAIEFHGYEALRIDQKPGVNKIDEEVITEIQGSRFLVADMTHGVKGARGSVYFEAGFAFALNIPVLFSCRQDKIDEVHFDTRQYYHVVWSNPQDLYAKLTKRIGEFVGTNRL